MNDVTADVAAQFGEEAAQEYIILMRALRSLTFMWESYIGAPQGSPIEAVISAEVNRMMEGLRTRPNHAVAMIEGLLTLLTAMRAGSTYEEWFEQIGLNPNPEGDDK